VDPGPVPLPGLSLSTDARVRGAPGAVVTRLRGELVIAAVPGLRDELASLLRQAPGRLVIELAGVTRCDVSGLAVLVGAGYRARRAGGSLGLAAPSPSVDEILHATGLHRHLDIFSTAGAATTGGDDPEPGPAAAAGPDRGAPGRRPFAYSQAAATRLRRVLDASRRPAIL
jgi:anti-anti-sigma factor